MCRPGVAINAAVLAAAIWIDRAVEREVGAVVGRNDAFCDLGADLCPPRPQLGERFPSVIEIDAIVPFEAAGRIGSGASPAPPLLSAAQRGRIVLLPDMLDEM